MSETLRLFIAIQLPDPIRDSIAQVQTGLRRIDGKGLVRWTAVDSIHLTLKFLGETPADRRTEIEPALCQAVASHKSFALALDGVGSFIRRGAPEIVWAGVGGDLGALHGLRDSVEQAIAPLGFPTEARPFSPHLTIGRARPNAAPRDLAALREPLEKLNSAERRPFGGSNTDWAVNEVLLMRSDLRREGAVYTALAYCPLGAP